jgi:hypothetical protein
VAVQFPAVVALSLERGGSVDRGGQAPPVDHLDLLKSVHHGTVVKPLVALPVWSPPWPECAVK